jgi:hypoxanthine-DNA glycosylase
MAKAATGFPPVIDGGVETLILGSFPSLASLGKAQYYGHPQNQFWRLVGAAIGEPLPEMDYETRKRTLLAHRIGLWDVIGACVRKGSLDADIRDPRHNDFARVTAVARGLRRIFFNGKTAGKFAPQFAAWGYETAVLPSSSPAYTQRYEEKLKQWMRIALPRQMDGRPKPRRRGSAFSSSLLAPHASLNKC